MDLQKLDERVREAVYRDLVASRHTDSRTEVSCRSGAIDVLTASEVIEIKRLSEWKNGIGQLIAYGFDFPDRKKRLHVLVPRSDFFYATTIQHVTRVCASVGISVTMEFEVDEEIKIITSYEVDGVSYENLGQIEKKLKKIRIDHEDGSDLSEEEASFVVALANLSNVFSFKSGSVLAIEARVTPESRENGHKKAAHFQVRGHLSDWVSVKMSSLIDAIGDNPTVKTVFQKNHGEPDEWDGPLMVWQG